MQTDDRLNLGLKIPYPFLDLSLHATGRIVESPVSVLGEAFNFMRPFSNETWLCLLATIVVTAVTFFLCRGKQAESE